VTVGTVTLGTPGTVSATAVAAQTSIDTTLTTTGRRHRIARSLDEPAPRYR
jgi:hypothetical protein